jgi:hypothetical protein
MVVFLGVRSGSWRTLIAIGLIVATVLLFPYLTTVQSWDQYRGAWQGRYGLPVGIGLVILATTALDRSGRDLRGPIRMLLFLLFVTAQTIAPPYTLLLERRESPQVDSSSWVQPSLLLTVVVAGVSAALMWWGAFGQDLPTKERHRAPA